MAPPPATRGSAWRAKQMSRELTTEERQIPVCQLITVRETLEISTGRKKRGGEGVDVRCGTGLSQGAEGQQEWQSFTLPAAMRETDSAVSPFWLLLHQGCCLCIFIGW
ncbi:hypothetical protein IHE44_0009829 [Lamprotornis superbus]|uniref:Uncharacterized protein n=1 Tax=Lamprotornis superbus TaxID=245042 RepID=A0A835NKQ3_9PASS|nr:hypothetical protein IHE44_0009829 [Lamprotornis superbus]